MAAGWYEIDKAKNGQYYFALKAGNAEVILTSEMYTTKASAEGGIASIQVNSPLDERYEKKTASNGQFYFVLKAANHQVIGNSQMYTTEAGRGIGVASVKTNGPSKTIKDKVV